MKPTRGRPPVDPQLKKVPYNTKLPKWLKDWLINPTYDASGPNLIEEALCKVFKLKPPKG